MSSFHALVRRRYEGKARNTHEDLSMSKLRVHWFSISLDGYGAGPDQGVEQAA
jgi:hypothetical protein